MARRKRRISTKLPTRKSVVTAPRVAANVGRNEPCPCESGKKYKDCHYADGRAFLEKLARQRDRQEAKQRRRRMKDDGVAWYRRIFLR